MLADKRWVLSEVSAQCEFAQCATRHREPVKETATLATGKAPRSQGLLQSLSLNFVELVVVMLASICIAGVARTMLTG